MPPYSWGHTTPASRSCVSLYSMSPALHEKLICSTVQVLNTVLRDLEAKTGNKPVGMLHDVRVCACAVLSHTVAGHSSISSCVVQSLCWTGTCMPTRRPLWS